jgi:hypothetical protein
MSVIRPGFAMWPRKSLLLDPGVARARYDALEELRARVDALGDVAAPGKVDWAPRP